MNEQRIIAGYYIKRALAACLFLLCAFVCSLVVVPVAAQKAVTDSAEVKAEHGGINIVSKGNAYSHSTHPGAQWYPEAGFGLFLHWGIASVKGINISWSMIPGRKLATADVSAQELLDIYKYKNFNMDGSEFTPTPNQYFDMAKDFNPGDYDADKWIKAARDAGFTYAVLTTKHHEGFALWPSAFNAFNTSLYMKGADLVAPFVKACRKYGLRVGLYYSPPDWYFEKDFKNFMDFQTIAAHPAYPALDADLNVRDSTQPNLAKSKQVELQYAAMVRGQVKELLTRYGKIDLLWFDGRPAIPNGENCITADEIRAIQPAIVINPRLHGTGDFKTFERTIPQTRENTDTAWAEFCNTWAGGWPYMKGEMYRANGFILGQLVKCRAMGINYLLGIGPKSDGTLAPEAYTNMLVLKAWMKTHQKAVRGVERLSSAESSSVPATMSNNERYLYLIPEYDKGLMKTNQLALKEETLVFHTSKKPVSVRLLGSNRKLPYQVRKDAVEIKVPVTLRTDLVDIVEIAF